MFRVAFMAGSCVACRPSQRPPIVVVDAHAIFLNIFSWFCFLYLQEDVCFVSFRLVFLRRTCLGGAFRFADGGNALKLAQGKRTALGL